MRGGGCDMCDSTLRDQTHPRPCASCRARLESTQIIYSHSSQCIHNRLPAYHRHTYFIARTRTQPVPATLTLSPDLSKPNYYGSGGARQCPTVYRQRHPVPRVQDHACCATVGSPGRTSCTVTARPACFTKVEAGCFTSARSPSTMTASIFSLNCLRKGSMSAWVVR
eukprot:scaffold46513_cov60-Phaeocystis_antarctica.AAC.1